jgi:hypothetical protein
MSFLENQEGEFESVGAGNRRAADQSSGLDFPETGTYACPQQRGGI